MGATKELLIRMSEQEFYRMPENVRGYLQSKMVTPEMNDWSELMEDELYASLYKSKKKVTKDLDQRAYDLREQRRKINN